MSWPAALASLPPELREQAERIEIKHDAAHTSIGRLRVGFEEVDSPRESPGAMHRAVLRHPETGREGLYLKRTFWSAAAGGGQKRVPAVRPAPY